MTRPDHLTVSHNRFVRYAGATAVAAALVGSLAACGSSSNKSSLSSSTTSATPSKSTPASASTAVVAEAKALLARLHFAEAKLATDYTWTAAAAGSSKTSVSSTTVTLFGAQRSALSSAHGSLSNAAHAARSAAQATPRNCSVVTSQRQTAYAAYNSGVAAYNAFVPAANGALVALGHTTADRAAVQAALNELKSFADAHPEADINMGTETGLAFAHSPADDKTLTDAVHAAQSSLAATYADLQKLRANVASIAPTCG